MILIKGQVGEAHPFYKHGMTKTTDFDSQRRDACISGVKQKANFRCFITGKTRKAYLACHHLNA